MRLEIKQLSKSYGEGDRRVSVIEDLSCVIEAGASVAFMGRSGVGKSTLLHLVAQLDQSTSGQILYDGIDTINLSDQELSNFRLQNLGFVFQFHHLLPEFTALENVAMPLLLNKKSREYAFSEAEMLLAKAGLKDRLGHYPGQLSGGQQQRVAVCRAMINKPRVLLADEPTGSLDYKTGQEVCELLLTLVKESAASLLVATHNRELAFSMQIVYEMESGGSLLRK